MFVLMLDCRFFIIPLKTYFFVSSFIFINRLLTDPTGDNLGDNLAMVSVEYPIFRVVGNVNFSANERFYISEQNGRRLALRYYYCVTFCAAVSPARFCAK